MNEEPNENIPDGLCLVTWKPTGRRRKGMVEIRAVKIPLGNIGETAALAEIMGPHCGNYPPMSPVALTAGHWWPFRD